MRTMTWRQVGLAWLLTSCAVVLSAPAHGQSAIAGIVTDETRGVLPGVTIEAASPVLIEKVRLAVTDADGRYSIVDLRPGTYSVTFSLIGFTTIVREGIALPSNFTASVNVMLTVGGIEESLTVSSASPVVDVQTTTRTQVLARSTIDALPTPRSTTSIGRLLPGVRMSVPDVGGGEAMELAYPTARGATQNFNTYEVDGMKLNSLSGDGRRTSYFNNAMAAEVSYQTSGHTAESAAGGVRVNMIPREGGNVLSGQLYAGGTAGPWIWDNVTDALRARGLTAGTSIAHIRDINISQGGPLLRDRLWFWGSGAFQSVDNLVADTFLKDGTQGREDQYVNNATLRLTAQLSSRNKIGAYLDRIWKFKGHEMGARVEPETASKRRDPRLYAMGQVKWTSPVSSRLLLEAGTAMHYLRYSQLYQPGIAQERGTPAWYAGASRTDRDLGTRWAAGTAYVYRRPDIWMWSASASYVTGSHAFKTGVLHRWGNYLEVYDANADLVQEYRRGVPDSVLVYNTPSASQTRMDQDLGVYAQDSWTIHQLTVNGGVRLEWFKGSVDETTQPAGRFAPVRHYPRMTGLPDWFDVLPRLGATYDLFGNAKTALKFTASKYVPGEATQFAKDYDPVYLASERRTWRDLNGDDIAQDNEIGPSQNVRFGIRSTATPDPDYKRQHDWEYAVMLQHELRPGWAVTGGWYRRNAYNLGQTINLLRSVNDWTPVTVVSPLTGELITAYNLKREKLGVVDLFATNAPDSDKRRQDYSGFELSSEARLPKGGNIQGGWTWERTVTVTCNLVDNPNTFRFCDEREHDLPYRHDFKLAAVYPLPLQFQASAVFVSWSGSATTVNWQVTPSTRYQDGTRVIPAMTESSLTIPLVPPGSMYLDRTNQLDLAIKRTFRFGERSMDLDVQVFNALNSAAVRAQTTTFGPALYRPTDTLEGRMLRLAVQAKW